MCGIKIQYKNITFRAVSGTKKTLFRGNGGFVLIYKVVKRIHSVSVPLGICERFLTKTLKTEEGQGIDGLLGGVRTIAIRLRIC